MTIRMCIQLPVFGKLGLILRPKKPNSQSTTRIATIVHTMRFLLLNDLLEATWSVDRVAVDLTAQQDENSSRIGEDRQEKPQTGRCRG